MSLGEQLPKLEKLMGIFWPCSSAHWSLQKDYTDFNGHWSKLWESKIDKQGQKKVEKPFLMKIVARSMLWALDCK